MGEKNPMLLSIPPGVAHGYRVLGNKAAALFYHTTEAYDPEHPDEERIEHDDPAINFDWSTKPR
jgi:dTDP-4-dehydrorhamnose 3,5-epimerase